MLLISAMAPEYPGAARCPGHPPPIGCRFPAFEAEVSEQRGDSGPRRASFTIPGTSIPRLPPLMRVCESRHLDARIAILLACSPRTEQEVETLHTADLCLEVVATVLLADGEDTLA